jgi:predicted GIY-YIG superfamily endonuclease
MKAAVYFIHTPCWGQYYIGSSQDVHRRLLDHRARLRKGDHKNARLQALHDSGQPLRFRVGQECADRVQAEALEAELLQAHFGKPGCLNASNTPFALACKELIAIPRTERQVVKQRHHAVVRLVGEAEAWYASGVAAARQLGIHASRITSCCRGESKTAAGSVWRFA